MLFRKKIERSCLYCAHAAPLSEEQVLCTRKGVVDAKKPCWKFKYDPCKRIPPKPKAVNFEKYKEEDYSL